MISDELVERVTAALWEHRFGPNGIVYAGKILEWDEISEESRETFRYMARAAIIAVSDAIILSEEEFRFWQFKFEQAVSEIRKAHGDVYRFTGGLEPSPRERERARKLLEGRE